jgi:hypothetical protein
MDDNRKPFKKKMCVTHQKVLASWPNGKGTGQTNLYEITAVDENGEVIREKLRSFAELEDGILIEYELEPYDHPQHGKSWTVKRPRSNTTQRVGVLEKQLEDVTDRVAAIEQHLGIGPAAIPAGKKERT